MWSHVTWKKMISCWIWTCLKMHLYTAVSDGIYIYIYIYIYKHPLTFNYLGWGVGVLLHSSTKSLANSWSHLGEHRVTCVQGQSAVLPFITDMAVYCSDHIFTIYVSLQKAYTQVSSNPGHLFCRIFFLSQQKGPKLLQLWPSLPMACKQFVSLGLFHSCISNNCLWFIEQLWQIFL